MLVDSAVFAATFASDEGVLVRCDRMVGVAGRSRRFRRVLRMLSFCLLLGSSMR